MAGDQISAMAGKLEGLLSRALRISRALRDGAKATPDQMFGYDLQHFRHNVRDFGNSITGLSSQLNSLERHGSYDEKLVRGGQSVMRLCDRLNRSLAALLDEARLAHEHIRQADHKVEAWYLVQELEALEQRARPLSGVANKILIKVSTPAKRQTPES